MTVEETKITTAKECTCPICNSHNVEYGSIEIDGNTVFYPCECLECGTLFEECYDLSFTGHANVVSDNKNIEWISK